MTLYFFTLHCLGLREKCSALNGALSQSVVLLYCVSVLTTSHTKSWPVHATSKCENIDQDGCASVFNSVDF